MPKKRTQTKKNSKPAQVKAQQATKAIRKQKKQVIQYDSDEELVYQPRQIKQTNDLIRDLDDKFKTIVECNTQEIKAKYAQLFQRMQQLEEKLVQQQSNQTISNGMYNQVLQLQDKIASDIVMCKRNNETAQNQLVEQANRNQNELTCFTKNTLTEFAGRITQLENSVNQNISLIQQKLKQEVDPLKKLCFHICNVVKNHLNSTKGQPVNIIANQRVISDSTTAGTSNVSSKYHE